MTLAIIIALLLGGGTSFAAENALPGDILYPIKIHVNENVQELAAVSDEAEAKVQAKLAMRRLEEAEKLAAKGWLNAKTSVNLKNRFEEYSKNSKEHQAKLEKDDANAAANISSDIEVSLGMHKKRLEDIEDTKPEAEDFLKEILEEVKHHLKESGDDRLEIEAKVFEEEGSDAQKSIDEVLSSAQNKIDEVRKFVDSKKNTVSVNASGEVDVYLKAAVATIAEGKAKIKAKADADAFALFKKATREAQTAKLFAAFASNAEIEIK